MKLEDVVSRRWIVYSMDQALIIDQIIALPSAALARSTTSLSLSLHLTHVHLCVERRNS